ncbi:MAG: hypothetical protein R2710_03240 [Acidimicrobiales bacterium]
MLNTRHLPVATATSDPRDDRPGERGSVVMSMLVLMVIGLLVASMFTYSQASARGSMRLEVQRSGHRRVGRGDGQRHEQDRTR